MTFPSVGCSSNNRAPKLEPDHICILSPAAHMPCEPLRASQVTWGKRTCISVQAETNTEIEDGCSTLKRELEFIWHHCFVWKSSVFLTRYWSDSLNAVLMSKFWIPQSFAWVTPFAWLLMDLMETRVQGTAGAHFYYRISRSERKLPMSHFWFSGVWTLARLQPTSSHLVVHGPNQFILGSVCCCSHSLFPCLWSKTTTTVK